VATGPHPSSSLVCSSASAAATTRGARGPPGAGLGLAIASAYARAVGGELRYKRASPRGARFTFTLPGART
jgi:signal transduction histidine kinase